MDKLKDTINNQEWTEGDKFFCPKFEDGKWITCGQLFIFLKWQYEAIEKGWAFRFNEVYDASFGKAMNECNQLVEELNSNIL